ncbi:MAG TPA: hypothetical protein PKH33_17960, partial [bacterium]|nr:hypothetical protein [bacterium]
MKILQSFPCAPSLRSCENVQDEDSHKNLFPNIFSLDMRQRRKRSSAFGAGMKDFERDFKGKLIQ